MVCLDLKEKSNHAFVLNGLRTVFSAEILSANDCDIAIDNQTVRISAIFENNNQLKVSCENIHHNISFPGLLTSYLEIQGDSDDNSKFKGGEIKSPLHGKIIEINIIENQFIKKGDLMMVIEAMKSENRILSPIDAKVKKIAVNVGDQVTDRTSLIFLED